MVNLASDQSQSKWICEKTVAAITGLSTSTLQKDRHHHRGIAYSKVGRSVRYAYDDVVAYMHAKKITFAA